MEEGVEEEQKTEKHEEHSPNGKYLKKIKREHLCEEREGRIGLLKKKIKRGISLKGTAYEGMSVY